MLLSLGMSSWAVATLTAGVAVAASAITAAAFLLRNRTEANRSLNKRPSGTTGAESWIQGENNQAGSGNEHALAIAGVTMLSVPAAVSASTVIGISNVGFGREGASGAAEAVCSPAEAVDESDTVGLLTRVNHVR